MLRNGDTAGLVGGDGAALTPASEASRALQGPPHSSQIQPHMEPGLPVWGAERAGHGGQLSSRS